MSMKESLYRVADLAMRDTDPSAGPEQMFSNAMEIKYVKTMCALAYMQGFRDAEAGTYTREQVLGLAE